MSNYLRITKHPITGKFEEAIWLDNCNGHHNYCVQFKDGQTFKADDYEWEFKD